MKRFAAVILTVMMMTTLVAGCGSKDTGSEKGTLNVYCFGDYFDPELEEKMCIRDSCQGGDFGQGRIL